MYVAEMRTYVQDIEGTGTEPPLSRVMRLEDTEAIEIDLKNAPVTLRAVAVDANKAYQEVDLGEIVTQGNTWTAPYPSDWAIALGNFEQEKASKQTRR